MKEKTLTQKVKTNIIFSFLLKGLSVAISLLVVPMTINYLNSEEYGLWITISSMITWISVLDIGLGNGLRNNLTKAIASNDYELGSSYISTTIVLLMLIIAACFVIFIPLILTLNWVKILNTTSLTNEDLKITIFIVFFFFCLQFIFKFLSTVFYATQRAADDSLVNVIGSLLSLIIIFILTKTVSPKLNNVVVVFSASPVVALAIACPIVFNTFLKKLKPSLKKVDFKYTNILLVLGVKFFIMQLASVLIYMTSNFIISHYFGPAEVTPYNISYKYFSFVTMIFGLIITPMWSAYTEAYVKKDFTWLNNSIKKIFLIWGVGVVGTVAMLLLSSFVYKVWIGNSVNVPFTYSLLLAIYVTLANWNNIFSYFLNGIGKVSMSLILSILVLITFIPIAIVLCKCIGVQGVIISTIITMIPSAVFMPIQMRKLLRQKANGIWNKD